MWSLKLSVLLICAFRWFWQLWWAGWCTWRAQWSATWWQQGPLVYWLASSSSTSWSVRRTWYATVTWLLLPDSPQGHHHPLPLASVWDWVTHNENSSSESPDLSEGSRRVYLKITYCMILLLFCLRLLLLLLFALGYKGLSSIQMSF